MISRVAENCFWLHRYLERAGSTAGMIEVNLATLLDRQISVKESWRALLVASGEEPAFVERLSAAAIADGDEVQDYLVWDRENPASIVQMLTMARENARTVRETISLEMWLAINGTWLWLTDGKARRAFQKDPLEFYARLRREVELLRALTHGTILHDEAFHFMRLGMLLERAGQTARLLDVKHHLLGPTDPGQGESPAEAAHWLALMRTLTATESFFKRGLVLSGAAVAQFLLLERDLPRSVRHCLVRAADSLGYVRELSEGKRGGRSATMLEALRTRLRTESAQQLFGVGLHEELTYMIDGIASLCGQIRADFFDPTLAEQEADEKAVDAQ